MSISNYLLYHVVDGDKSVNYSNPELDRKKVNIAKRKLNRARSKKVRLTKKLIKKQKELENRKYSVRLPRVASVLGTIGTVVRDRYNTEQGLRDNTSDRGFTNERGSYVNGFLPEEALEENENDIALPAYLQNSNFVDMRGYQYENDLENEMNRITMKSDDDSEVIQEIKKPSSSDRTKLKKLVYDNFSESKIIKFPVQEKDRKLRNGEIIETDSDESVGWNELIKPTLKPVSPSTKERNKRIFERRELRKKAVEYVKKKEGQKEKNYNLKIKKEKDRREIERRDNLFTKDDFIKIRINKSNKDVLKKEYGTSDRDKLYDILNKVHKDDDIHPLSKKRRYKPRNVYYDEIL